MLRRSQAICLVAAFVSILPAIAEDRFVRYESQPVPSSKVKLSYSMGYPAGWSIAWGGDRVRFFPSEAEGPHSSATYAQVEAYSLDEPGAEALIGEKDGLERWLGSARPRFEIEDRRQVKVGAHGAVQDALLVKDPAQRWTPDRRALLVRVRAGDVNFVITLSAPLADFSSLEPAFRSVLASFETSGG